MDFRILGPIEVFDGERPLALGGARQRALLGMLLLHAGEVVSSDRLIEELWPGERGEDASGALQVAVSRLRKSLQPAREVGTASRLLVTRPPGYGLLAAPESIDAKRFEALAERGRRARARGAPREARELLGEALGLWRGQPLADLAYESFCQAEIGRLEELRLAVLEDWHAAGLELGEHAELVGRLRALVREQPLRERPWAQLMLALYRSGRQAEALDAYAKARTTLVEELGIEPGRELRELQQAILEQDPALELEAVPEAGTAPTAQPGRGAFVGRASELAELLVGLDQVLSGAGRLFLVAGEPGIGKSRLTEELAAHAVARGARVLVGRCWEAGGAPAYWPWVQALRVSLRDADSAVLRSQLGSGATELARLLPELRERFRDLPEPPSLESEAARFRLFDAVAEFLRKASESGPIVLVLDDLHAADAPSLLLLRFVAGGLGHTPILIIGCYRDTEVEAALAEALVDLSRQAAGRRLALKGLGGSDTARLLELTMGGVLKEELAARIHAGTDGNPFFAAEIGRLLASEGAHDQTQGRLPIPQGVREAIGLRLQRQSEACREVLTLASVIGREFGIDALERASGLPEDDLFVVLEEAAAARLVGDAPGTSGRLRFSHILVRDALYEDLAAPRRLRLHRAIGETLEALYARDPEPHLAELAHHFLAAGSLEAEKAIEYAERAGDRAASQHGYEEAARHYTNALRVLETTGSDDGQRTCELMLSLGQVLSRAGQEDDAKTALRRAAALAEHQALPDQLARAALAYGGRFSWARASSDPALVPLLERALAVLSADEPRMRACLLARLAAARRDDPRREHRIALGREAVAIAKELDDPQTLALALEGEWHAIEGPDTVEEWFVLAEKLLALAQQTGDKERLYTAHEHRLNAFWRRCDRAAIDVEMDALGRLVAELRQPPHRWAFGTFQTMLALMEGRLDEAEQLIADTSAIGERAVTWNAAVSQRIGLFVLRREQGRLAELEDTISRSVYEYPALLRFACALAHLHSELGRPSETRALVDELVARDLAHEHLDVEWLFSLSLLPDPCAFLGDEAAAERLHALLLPYEDHYAQAPAEGVFGCVARALGVLATTARRFDQAEQHFALAIETERQMRARPWLAHAEHDLAAMLLTRRAPGDPERARSLLYQARAAYHELDMHAWATRCDELAESGSAGA
jgi:DNA-binding SARP family transcriptional activator